LNLSRSVGRTRSLGGRGVRFVAGVLVVGIVGLTAGAVLGTASGGPTEVTISVPGALNLSVYCGGKHTHFADGESVTFHPEGTSCDLEAPLSQVMPLRGRVELTRASKYRCAREQMDLVCSPD